MGRKKIICSLGKKQLCSFWAYPIEIEKLRIEYKKLKQQRKKYQKTID